MLGPLDLEEEVGGGQAGGVLARIDAALER